MWERLVSNEIFCPRQILLTYNDFILWYLEWNQVNKSEINWINMSIILILRVIFLHFLIIIYFQSLGYHYILNYRGWVGFDQLSLLFSVELYISKRIYQKKTSDQFSKSLTHKAKKKVYICMIYITGFHIQYFGRGFWVTPIMVRAYSWLWS